MTGKPNLNFPAFNSEAYRLRCLGYDVVNPAELNKDQSASWHECMKTDLKALLDCDAVCLIEGWQASAGAHLEMHIAHRVGIKILIAKELA